ncbi:hypothetical protein M5D96_006784 [Drosophila gunungcola]|uniref:Uncharacterized protein n=1 Tax=Drosophila gunungcola TaxID=103775 RepID=A0A9P9YPR0_9MUSC|nr:hypothetical protein M5D96_006784 [Drosophila gunungcola]
MPGQCVCGMATFLGDHKTHSTRQPPKILSAIDQKPKGGLHLIVAHGMRNESIVQTGLDSRHPLKNHPVTQSPNHQITQPPTSAWRAHNLVILFTV